MKPPYLNENVLFYVLTYLDVASVIQCQRVSRYFQALARSKQIWMFLVRDLSCRGLIYLPPPDVLSTYSTMQLVAEVKRIVVGPTTWLSHSDRQPTVRRQLHIPLGSDSLAPRMLPGGRHLLVERGVARELWDITKSRRIWMRNGVNSRRVAVESTYGKEELTLALVISTMPMTLEVLRLNLDNDIMQHVVASHKLPSWFSGVLNAVIEGDFIALAVNSLRILLLNWKESKCAILRGPFAINLTIHPLQSLHLIPGHLVALTAARSAKVLLYPITAFESQWLPMTPESLDAAAESSVVDGPIKPAVLQLVEYPKMAGCRAPQLFVHECPLRHSSFVVSTNSVCASDFQVPPGHHLHPSFHRFRLTISEPTSMSKWHWRHLFSSGSVTKYKDLLMTFTYAGYGLSINRAAYVNYMQIMQVVYRASTDGGRVPIPPQKSWTRNQAETHHEWTSSCVRDAANTYVVPKLRRRGKGGARDKYDYEMGHQYLSEY
ncbi:hypothetical protein GGX14DRAFT_618716 [Mycena pura]|uniref:F-box domain-containing protein n=1 Tax=Mycena pura TaxID=153505 RepID=A0AAD6VLP6_9AGAR|nr:hypothetical protein GGX14DRAFT_618716 [Mycena pura]